MRRQLVQVLEGDPEDEATALLVRGFWSRRAQALPIRHAREGYAARGEVVDLTLWAQQRGRVLR